MARWAGILLLIVLGPCGCASRTTLEQEPNLAQDHRTEPNAAPPAATPPTDDPMGDGFGDEFTNDFADFEKEFDTPTTENNDPLERWNRGVFAFNDKAYTWVLRPVARSYRAVTPEPVRLGTRNFFKNLAMPVRLVNCLLQGKFRGAALEIGRFSINTVVGVFGCVDPAADVFGWSSQDEDLGQTLAVWGVADGPYLVWPLMGPSTLRDIGGGVGDYFLKPLSYLDTWKPQFALGAIEYTNLASFSIENYDLVTKEAVEPYVIMREGYRQYRLKKIQE